jgi:6-phosphogluconate dehydrogenase
MLANNIGVIGTGPMGSNLSLNIEDKGYLVSIYDISKENIEDFISSRAKNKKIFPYFDLAEFVKSLESPKKIILMIKAGKPVDETIEKLVPFLGSGDLIIDSGNSFYKDTIRRDVELAKKNIFFIGAGISGGEEGALKGPAIMPGGCKEAYDMVKGIFESIAAKAEDNTPCVSYIGPNGAGHFVKMVHNGIEYGDMELIGETVWALKNALDLNVEDIADIMLTWNDKNDILSSYLIEITGRALSEIDKDSKLFLVDRIADITRMKGTGTWTVQSALELLVPIPTIASAVFSREMSQDKDLRLIMSEKLKLNSEKHNSRKNDLVDFAHDALYIAKISSYAQGFALLDAASKKYGFNLNMGNIAKGWRAGCIVRAQFLNEISEEFDKNPKLINLLFSAKFSSFIEKNIDKLVKFIEAAHQWGTPVPAFDSAYNYIVEMSSPVMVSAQVTAIQRDYFGAHGYFKLQKDSCRLLKKEDGSLKEYHTKWMEPGHPEIEI